MTSGAISVILAIIVLCSKVVASLPGRDAGEQDDNTVVVWRIFWRIFWRRAAMNIRYLDIWTPRGPLGHRRLLPTASHSARATDMPAARPAPTRTQPVCPGTSGPQRPAARTTPQPDLVLQLRQRVAVGLLAAGLFVGRTCSELRSGWCSIACRRNAALTSSIVSSACAATGTHGECRPAGPHAEATRAGGSGGGRLRA